VLSAGDPPNVGVGGITVIVIGIDAHKYSHTAAIVERSSGQVLADVTVAAGDEGHLRLLELARGRDSERVWAIEDCRNVTGALERFLLRAGERAVRVHPKLMASERKVARRPGKSDVIDATAVARAAIREPELPVAYLAGPEREIAWLVDHRAQLVAERTRVACRLRWLLHDLDPGLQPPKRGLGHAPALARLDRALAGLQATAQVRIGRRLIERLGQLNSQIAGLTRELGPLVARRHALLLAVPGCGVITAARLIAEIANVARFGSDAKLASYAGVAPVDASSGKQLRHRLNRAGNRQLNAALHVIALTQARIHAPAREYLARRRAEGKTAKEGLRALKRHLARHIYRLFTTIHGRGQQPRLQVTSTPSTPCLT
jgi:transposase